MTTPKRRRSLLDSVGGFYAAQILAHFQAAGVIADLRATATAAELASRYGYDAELLHGLLEFLWRVTDVVERRGARYRIAAPYRTDYSLEFAVDKYIRAYGPCLSHLDHSLRAGDLGRPAVRRDIEAAAYHRVQSPPNPVVLELVDARPVTSLLDLGCGPATMLRMLARANRRFTGWGIDQNRHMAAEARRRARQEGVEDRVHVFTGDARRIEKRLRPADRESVEVVHTKGLMNELFRGGSSREAAAYLRYLCRLFPGRLLFNVDYYGVLTRTSGRDPAHEHTVLHDLIQLVTAQGVPPADLAGWNRVYEEGGCALEEAFEGDSRGIRWFVHVVRLRAA